MESKPRFRPDKHVTDHYRLHLTTQATGTESFACFASQGLAGAWLMQQVGVTAVLSLVDGPDCFYCRAKEGEDRDFQPHGPVILQPALKE